MLFLRQDKRVIFVLLAFVLFYVNACATKNTFDAKLNADKVGTVSKLDEGFNITARLGNLPTSINPEESIARYAIQTTGLPSEVLIILEPKYMQGTLTLPLAEASSSLESAVEYEEYLDLILRAHRRFLGGKFDEAEKIIAVVEGKYDVTYGSLVLKANLALIRGNRKLALESYQMAKQLMGNAPNLDAFIVESSREKKSNLP